MSANIFERIINAEYKFEYATSRKPTRLYLGQNDWTALHESVSLAQLDYRLTFGKYRPYFRGNPVYEVDAEDYIAVGI